MDPKELDELARAVASRLAARTGRGRRASVKRDDSKVLPIRATHAVRAEEKGVGGPWEVPDVAWRMPIGSRQRGADGGGAGVTVSHPPRSAAFSAPRALTQGPVRVADFIDHTLLKAEATRAEIEKLCAEAKEHRFAAVCVNGCWVPRCAQLLRGTGVKVAAVVGFPLGAVPSAAKAAEARQLAADGADELDMVAAIGHILDEDWDYVEDDVRAVVEAAGGRTVKVILETAALQPMLIVKAAAIAKEAGAQFVKTSTGFHPTGGASPEAVALLRLAVGDALGVKAAGGIRDCTTALKMIAAGANRLGTSGGVNLVGCLGAGPMPLTELLAEPDRHQRVCKTGECASEY